MIPWSDCYHKLSLVWELSPLVFRLPREEEESTTYFSEPKLLSFLKWKLINSIQTFCWMSFYSSWGKLCFRSISFFSSSQTEVSKADWDLIEFITLHFLTIVDLLSNLANPTQHFSNFSRANKGLFNRSLWKQILEQKSKGRFPLVS